METNFIEVNGDESKGEDADRGGADGHGRGNLSFVGEDNLDNRDGDKDNENDEKGGIIICIEEFVDGKRKKDKEGGKMNRIEFGVEKQEFGSVVRLISIKTAELFHEHLREILISKSVTPVIISNNEVRKYPLGVQLLRRSGKGGIGSNYYGFLGKMDFNDKINKMEHSDVLRRLLEQRGEEERDEVLQKYCDDLFNEDKLKVMPMDIKKCKLFEDKGIYCNIITNDTDTVKQTYQYIKDIQCFEESM